MSSALLKEAVHQHHLTSKIGVWQRLFSSWFNNFVYNQIWEDPRVDLKALQINADSNILTIASGGCNILNYLVEKPNKIIAIDLNPYHMHLTRLKLAAFKYLPNHSIFYDFFGHANIAHNIKNYQTYIIHHLDKETRAFWETKNLLGSAPIDYFSKNFYRYARFGYFVRFLHWISKISHTQPQRLLQARNLAEQEQIFHEEVAPFFQHWLIKLVGNLPLSVFSLGIPPQQYQAMKEESGGNLVKLYYERIRRLSCDYPIQENYYAWQAFSLSYDHKKYQAIPDYLKAEHYETIKYQLNKVETHITSLISFLKEQPTNSLDRFVFLDAQDWMSNQVLIELWSEILRVGKYDSRIIFRTASIDSPLEKALPPELLNQFTYEKEFSNQLFKQDRSAIYGGFHVYSMA
jgi:S-adenosylmethionine-diacylglycerol 3-amino-3-carboxypropyl transferase